MCFISSSCGKRFVTLHRPPPDMASLFPNFLPFSKDRKSTRLNSSHVAISYAVFCLKKKNRVVRKALRMAPHVEMASRAVKNGRRQMAKCERIDSHLAGSRSAQDVSKSRLDRVLQDQ